METSERVQIIHAYFAGFKELLVAGKDWLVVLVSLATLWIQTTTASKIDVAAAKTEVVKEKLDASTEVRDMQLEAIKRDAKEGRDTIVGWKESYEHKPAAKVEAPQP